LAAIPVVSTFQIGTTQFGWTFEGVQAIKVSLWMRLSLGFFVFMCCSRCCGNWSVSFTSIGLARNQRHRHLAKSALYLRANIAHTNVFLSGLSCYISVIWLWLTCLRGWPVAYTGYLLTEARKAFWASVS